MDEVYRATLKLIEAESAGCQCRMHQRQLLLVAKDYVDADELGEARRVLQLIGDAFYDELPSLAVSDEALSEAVAVFVDIMGLGWEALARPSCGDA